MSCRVLAVVALLAPALALASVGAVTALEGHGVRTPRDGGQVALVTGAELEVGDTLEVQDGAAQLELSDGSTLLLSEHSKLTLDEATFAPLERHFSAKLLLGSVWASVTHALEGQKSTFEVSTDRAVAGVRGTVFEVDVDASTSDDPETAVSVEEGQVAVEKREPMENQPRLELLQAGQGIRVRRRLFLRALARHRAASFERFVLRHRKAAIERRQRRLERIERRRRRRKH
jgi:hypothetical protein